MSIYNRPSQSGDTYFAADKSDKCVDYLMKKSNYWFNLLNSNRYLDKLTKSWEAYHGSYYSSSYTDSHSINFGGESGELANMAVNHYRNIARHMHTMITSSRPSFQARSINTDYKSQVQTTLANGLLEYYLREKKMETFLKTAVEYAIVLGSGYVKMEWNATSGKIYDYIEPSEDKLYDYNDKGEPIDEQGNKLSPSPVYEGDVEFTNLSPFDVVFDSTKESPMDHDWVLCRSFKNKYDLIAKYPELREEILKIRTKSDNYYYRMSLTALDETVDVPVYEFYHKRTESLPEGRYLLYLDEDTILMDTIMPYRSLPVYPIMPSHYLGTPYGYTPMFDLMPMQDAVNSLYSTILTNNNAFGVQSILSPRGNDIRINQVEEGLNFIEYNARVAGGADGRPEALQLTRTAPETYQFLQMLVRDMETISGVNSVARGNPESSLKSGTALALVQSQALQFMSGLQQSYVTMIENIGTGLVELLQDFAKVPRIAAIAGKSNKTKMQEFSAKDIHTINRVVVDVGNSLAQCLAKDTPVLMYDGSIKMVQDIKIGEKVMGPDSKPRTVENVNSGREEMFDITSKCANRNIKYTCNKSHILTLRYCSDDDRYNVKKGDILDLSVGEYLELPERHRRLLQGFTTSVEFEQKETQVPAYILGAWLGDGTSETTALTTMDDEIYLEWSNYAFSIGMQIRKQETKNQSNTYFITSGQASGGHDRNPLMNEFRSMEIIGNKHIPEIYLKNDRKTRLELLAGLIDTDGSLVDNTFVFTQKSKKLIDQVEYLAKSLGFRVTKKLVEREFNDKEANIYKLNIGGNTWDIPTRLPRKQVKKKDKIKNWNNYAINVNSIGMGTYYGFTLKEEPHFLLGDFSVTHNTTAGRVQMADNLIQMGVVTNPEQYFSVINSGRLESMTEGANNQALLIRAENERLADGETDVVATAVDKHSLHIREHMNVLADPDLRMDAELTKRVLSHIQEHILLLQQTDPNLLALIGEQPLSPPGGTPIGPQSGQPEQPNQSLQPMSNVTQNPIAESTQVQGSIPEPAQPPIDPATGLPFKGQ